MSKLGKSIVFLLILTSLASAVLGLWIHQKRQVYQGQLVAIEEQLKKIPPSILPQGDSQNGAPQVSAVIEKFIAELNQAKEQSEQAKARIQELETELQAAKANEERLVIENTEASKQVKAINDQLVEARAELVPVKAKLKEMEDLLAGRSIQSLLDEVTRLQGLLSIPAGSNTTPSSVSPSSSIGTAPSATQTQPQAAPSSQSSMSGSTGASASYSPSAFGSKAKILAVNKSWNFVVLNMGREARLPINTELPVYRGSLMLGKVRTVSVESKTAVADILPEFKEAGIAVGDLVLFNPTTP